MTEENNTAPTSKPETGPTQSTELTASSQALSDPEIIWRLDERKALALGRASEAVPKAFRGKPADIIAAWMMADELGISRMAMLRGAFVINGKPQLSGDLMLAVARGAGVQVKEYMTALDDQDKDGEPVTVAVCEATLPSGEMVTSTFSTIDAKTAGLWGGSDPWKKYPQRMLRMRARGWCLRDAIPDKLAGIYTEGEIIDV